MPLLSLQAVGYRTYEDATMITTIQAVRKRGKKKHKQARDKSHSPPINIIALLGWRSRAVVITVWERGTKLGCPKLNVEHNIENCIVSRV